MPLATIATVPQKLTVPLHSIDADLPMPSYARPGDAGADLYARTDAHLGAGGGRALVPTGVVIAIPEGYAGFVLPRSGLALRHGVTCLNTPGLIDSGYRVELAVLLVNSDPKEHYDVRRGDRIAQLVVQPVAQAVFEPVGEDALPLAVRGAAGFGHSGR
jgi:dUTP pyrophosphatase